MAKKSEGMLSPYRVLDLTGEKGLLCGKILGDLGADVIKIEPPEGDPGRHLAPWLPVGAERLSLPFVHANVNPVALAPSAANNA